MKTVVCKDKASITVNVVEGCLDSIISFYLHSQQVTN